MPNKYPQMRLSPEEDAFLRRWVYDEGHYQEGVGPAKRLQVEHAVRPADLAVIIAAAFPEPADQEAMALGTSPEARPAWPWSEEEFAERVAEARATLARRTAGTLSTNNSNRN